MEIAKPATPYDGVAGRELVEKLSAWEESAVNHDHVVSVAARSVTRNGAGVDARLRAVEDVVREIKADVKSFGDRLPAVEGDIREIKVHLQHAATRAWVLGGILAGMGVAAGIGVGLARLFLAP